MTEDSQPANDNIRALAIALLALTAIGTAYWLAQTPPVPAPSEAASTSNSNEGLGESTSPKSPALEAQPANRRQRLERDPRFVNFGEVTFWWDAIPEAVREVSVESGPSSNMHREDYVGAEACMKCHEQQYNSWQHHSHRRMNALATPANVDGNFTDGSMQYLGGNARFYREEESGRKAYRMKLERDGVVLVYDVLQTIGSRFFQYYVGRMLEGPFPPGHPYREINHVLPFGYWLERQQWVPVVHVGPELPDGKRDDPFDPRSEPMQGETFLPYASNCSVCHTTFPLADDLTRKPREIARHAPSRMHWNMSEYFQQHHPEIWGGHQHPSDVPTDGIHKMPQALMSYEAAEHAVNLGISCEACHLGCKEHVENPKILPDFHPHSPHLLVEPEGGELKTGRVHQNVNWACGRCHVGGRPLYAGGMSTWNSVEYSDAMVGSCYSELKCIDCHSPHEGIGAKWSKTPQEDNASCIRCHEQFSEPSAVTAHTHHAADSSGSQCMNCHMPHINEGLQNVVRTHTIFSPTQPAMIEANHPNACNLCHLDQPIDWTLRHLKQWYDASFDEQQIAQAYPQREQSVGRGWLESEYEAVRLAASAAVMRQNQREMLLDLADTLDDPYLLNRQFGQRGLEAMTGIDTQALGYRFYMTPGERAGPLAAIRKAVEAMADDGASAASPSPSASPLPPLETVDGNDR